MEEQWVSCFDTDAYEVSSEGQIRNARSGRILKPYIDEYGRETVCIRINGRQRTKKVHRLVAEAFYGEACIGMEIYHYDGDKQNNRIENLRIGDRSDVVKNSYQTGKLLHKGMKRIRVVETGEVFDSIGKCSKATGLSRPAISRSLNRRSLKTKEGYHFELVE